MSKLRAKNIEPATGTTLTLGASGDTIAVSSDSVQANTWQDTGGNSLFVSDGSGTLSNVNIGFGGGYALLKTEVADGSSSIDITSSIDSTYDEYMFICTNLNPSSDTATFQFQVNAAGGSGFNETITSTYFRAYNAEDGSGAALEYMLAEDQAQGTAYQDLSLGTGHDASECTDGILHLFSPSSTTYVKQFYSRFNEVHSSLYSMDLNCAGYINTTSAIDEISFKFDAGTFDGTIQMYGVG